MNKVEDKLLDILRYEVLAQDRTDNNTISLEESKQLLRLAKEHTVQGVVANAVVNNKIHIVTQQAQESDRKKIIYDFVMFDMMQKHHYENYKQALVDFASLKNKYHIPYVIFKGMAVAQFYPSPYSRSMGDVDFYVPSSHFMQAVDVIEKHWQVTIERDEIEKHYCFDFHGIRFEMHYKIETFGSVKHQKYFNQMIDITFSNTTSFSLNGIKIAILPVIENLIVVFKHWFNHLLLEGIGLRQTLDLAVLLNAYKDKIDVALLQKHLLAIGYWKAFKATVAMMEQRFGLPSADYYCNLEKNDYCYGNKLLQVVLESGNFGRKKYKTLVPGTKKSMETAKRTFVHYVKFFWLAPMDILFLIPKRIRITMKKRM